jgi:hypothetical protein
LINGLAFYFSHKTFMVEEVKNVWLYELPLTASPLDSTVALDIGPHEAVIGTLFRPNHVTTDHALQTLLADTWTWDDQKKLLKVKLKKNITYGNKDPITADQFVNAHEFIKTKLGNFSSDSIFGILRDSTFVATPDGLTISFAKLPKSFDLENFLREALTHPLSGVIHPKNLAALQAGTAITKDWITSGAYLISSWKPKEIDLISRSDFPVGMIKDVLRTIKYQSAPVKNPSCEFLQARTGDERTMDDHKAVDSESRESVLWMCRSYRQEAFCKDPENRKILSKLIAGTITPNPNLLTGKTLRYRIPFGSDAFRNAIRDRLTSLMQAAGGKAEETSYFFKNSKDTDLELEFVTAPNSDDPTAMAIAMAGLSSRLGSDAAHEPDLVGIVESFPLQILIKDEGGEPYAKLFLDPELDQKKLPL